MDTADIIAYIIVYIAWLVVIFILTGISKKTDESKLSFSQRVIVSVLLSIILSGVAGPLSEKITEFTKRTTKHAQESIATFIRVSMDSLGGTVTDEQDKSGGKQDGVETGGDEEPPANTVDTSLPLEDRVAVPCWSAYPDQNMVSVDVNASHRYDNGGYHGAPGGSSFVTYAFTADDKDGTFRELETEILHNPYFTDMVMMELHEHYDIEWINEFYDKTAAAFNENKGISIWYAAYQFSDGQYGAYVTDEYRSYAEKLCKFLEGFDNLGIQEKQVRSYYMSYPDSFYSSMRTHLTTGEFIARVLVLEDDGFQLWFDLNDKGIDRG